ncbi:nucleoside triphosphate pyrophosphohydrolase [Clostridium formicaceticum]|uniref:nucleoside triphosphate pyrophosphohydrolase n=1 Tax=Clostridium formicaceticum TaxID=1497 RepID=UPI003AADFF29
MKIAKLTIVGLGPGAKEHLTLATLTAMKQHKKIYLRTEKHPVVAYLKGEGIVYQTFDAVYEEKEDFQEVYQHIVDDLVNKAKREDILYAVPGHPYVAENTVQMLIEACRKEKEIEKIVYPAMSFIDAMFMALEVDPVNGFKLLDGLQLEKQEPDTAIANIITQVYDPLIASEVKLRLMNYYEDEQEIFVVKNAGIPQLQRIEKIPLYMLDRLDWIDYLTSLYIPGIDTEQKKYYNVNNLVEIMEILRSKEGCPWDIKQTHDSLKPYLIEESYEVLEAIDKKDDILLEEELGDLLLQVIFHSQIAKERNVFTMEDVVQGICEKLIFRHPHVFRGVKADTSKEALQTWEQQKQQEKQIKSIADSMTMIPKELPALLKAVKVQKKAANVGFDWDELKDVVSKVKEELQEVLEAEKAKDAAKLSEEIGDLIFAAVNLSRFLKVDPEDALNATCRKFINRFQYIEMTAAKEGKTLEEMTLKEMDLLWEKAKQRS